LRAQGAFGLRNRKEKKRHATGAFENNLSTVEENAAQPRPLFSPGRVNISLHYAVSMHAAMMRVLRTFSSFELRVLWQKGNSLANLERIADVRSHTIAAKL
jgi:hypothetical protein